MCERGGDRMVLNNKSDKQLIKGIKKLWHKRTGAVNFSIWWSAVFWFGYATVLDYIDKYINLGFMGCVLILIAMVALVITYAIVKFNYYNKPSVYEKNTRDLWEYKRELESRGYSVKVIERTTLSARYGESKTHVVVVTKG